MPDPLGSQRDDDPEAELISLDSIEEQLEKSALPHETREVIVSLVKQSFEYQGPPTPEMFRGWEEVIPGLGTRMMDSAEAMREHVVDMEQRAMSIMEAESTTNQDLARRGQPYAFTLGLLSLLLGVTLIALDHAGYGLTVVLVGVITLAGSFLVTRLGNVLGRHEKGQDSDGGRLAAIEIRLRKLEELRDSQAISQQEFNEQKARILSEI